MVSYCAAFGCKNTKEKGSGITLFMLPSKMAGKSSSNLNAIFTYIVLCQWNCVCFWPSMSPTISQNFGKISPQAAEQSPKFLYSSLTWERFPFLAQIQFRWWEENCSGKLGKALPFFRILLLCFFLFFPCFLAETWVDLFPILPRPQTSRTSPFQKRKIAYDWNFAVQYENFHCVAFSTFHQIVVNS